VAGTTRAGGDKLGQALSIQQLDEFIEQVERLQVEKVQSALEFLEQAERHAAAFAPWDARIAELARYGIEERHVYEAIGDWRQAFNDREASIAARGLLAALQKALPHAEFLAEVDEQSDTSDGAAAADLARLRARIAVLSQKAAPRGARPAGAVRSLALSECVVRVYRLLAQRVPPKRQRLRLKPAPAPDYNIHAIRLARETLQAHPALGPFLETLTDEQVLSLIQKRRRQGAK
jgi:hypothetical protein